MAQNIARVERQALCDLLEKLGPDAPTLSGEWTTGDLAVHLVLRESRLDAAAGNFIKPLSAHRDSVWAKIAAREWPDLIAALRDGPPKWSPFAIPGVDARANLAEMYVHHEDIRRAQPGWAPRPADGERYRALEANLMRMGRFLLRSSPLTVRLDPGTGQPFVGRASTKQGSVTVVGSPDELMLWCFGRESHARVELIGSPEDVAAIRAAPRGF